MKRIRTKFFCIAAGSLLLVLLLIISGLNIAYYVNLENRNKQDIEFILSRQNIEINVPVPQDPEIEFRNRYFISTYIDDNLVNIDMSHVVKITLKEAENLSNEVKSQNRTNGYINYFYFMKSGDAQITQYVFLDRQNELDMFNKTLITSIIIAAIGYVLVLVLVYILSLLVIKPIEEADKKQKQFITDASHELKTPLTIISSNTDIIEMENGKSEWTESTKNQIERLIKMTNDLVALSKLNENKIITDKTSINLSEMISVVVEPYISLLKNRNINLTINVEEECIIEGDVKLINNLFSTLMDNMNKYALEGDASISVTRNKNCIIINFINVCNPNTIENPDRLFDRFYKGDSSRNSSSNGFGVGLSMAKRVVELHKGKINATLNNNVLTIKIIF